MLLKRIQYAHLPRTRASSIVSSVRRTNEFVVLLVPLFHRPRPLDAVCDETNSPKSYRYHPGLWSGKKWLCCKTINRTAFGCQAATHWSETNNNPTSSKYHFILHSIQKRFVSVSPSIARPFRIYFFFFIRFEPSRKAHNKQYIRKFALNAIEKDAKQ